MRIQGMGYWAGLSGLLLGAAFCVFPSYAGKTQAGLGRDIAAWHYSGGETYQAGIGGQGIEGAAGSSASEDELSTGTIEVDAGGSASDGDGGSAGEEGTKEQVLGISNDAPAAEGGDAGNAAGQAADAFPQAAAVLAIADAASQSLLGEGIPEEDVLEGASVAASALSGIASAAGISFEGPAGADAAEAQGAPGDDAPGGSGGDASPAVSEGGGPGNGGAGSGYAGASGQQLELGSSSDDLPRSSATELVEYARKFIGVLAYARAGASLVTGADCSGFVQQLYKHFGISIPRDSRSQYAASMKISAGDLRPGDLIFYGSSPESINHVGIYSGDGTIIHSTHSGDYVRESDVFYVTPFGYGRFSGAG